MRAHIVLAHPEPRSFNAHLARVAREALTTGGWSVTTTDLYAMGFDATERGAHYRELLDPWRLDVMAQQRFASRRQVLPPEVTAEISMVDAADLVLFQYPMWWHMPPAMLKGWFDRVLVYGEVYSSAQRFESGRFAGKRAMLSVTVATSPATYAHDGRSADINLLLWPVHFTLAYVGFGVLELFVAYDVREGARFASELARSKERLIERLRHFGDEPLIPFNRMSDWGEDGRIKPGAPVFSPFIRHRDRLDLG